MEFIFKKELSIQDLDDTKDFYNSLEWVTIEQHPEWNALINSSKNNRYFILKADNKISCFAVIEEKNLFIVKVANISFGPIFNDVDSLITSIIEIEKFYKLNKFSYLSIQLAMPTGTLADYVEYKLNQVVKIKYNFNKENWSSLFLDLSEPLSELNKKFSKGHKSAIKKAGSNGISVRRISSLNEVETLAKIYLKMNIARDLPNTQWPQIKSLFDSIFEFFEHELKGFFLAVFDESNVMIGGIIVAFQGNTARYYKGASDPDRKDISVLHVALFEAFKISKESGFRYFDLWGYNHFVNEGDQIFYINRFKKGFTHNYLFYPKLMHMPLRPIGYFLFKLAMTYRHRLNFLVDLVKKK